MKQTALFLLLSLDLLGYGFGKNDSKESYEQAPFTLLVTPKLERLMLVSPNEKVAILEYQSYMVFYHDNKKGDYFVISYKIDQGVYIPGDVSDNKKNYNSSSLKELYGIGVTEGYQFDMLDVAPYISERLSQILADFSNGYWASCQSLGVAFEVGKTSCDNMHTSLKGFANVTGESQTTVRGDLKWLVDIFIGFGFYFKNFEGGIGALSEKHIKLDLHTVMNLDTGSNVLVYLLEITSSKFNLGKLVGDRLNSALGVFELVVYLGGKQDYGYEAFINVMYEILKYNNGKSSRRNLIANLNKFVNHPKADYKGVEQKWTADNNHIIETLYKLKLTGDFKELVTLAEEIHDRKWIDNGVNMTEVFQIIITNSKNKDIVKKVFKVLDKEKKGNEENSEECGKD